MDMTTFSLSLLFFLSLVSTVRGYLHMYPPVDENDTRTPLYFALLQSFGGQYNGSGAVAGLQVALDRINRDPTLLPGYTLHYTLTDTQCNRTVALHAFYNQVIPGPVKIAMIGSGCSVATEPTAENSPYYNITHISCVSSSTELVNRVRFRYYFQLLPTSASVAPSYFGIIRQYGWKRVGLIVQNENVFTVTVDHLKQMLETINVTYIERMFETGSGATGLGPQLFAYNLNLHYPRHTFITTGWYAPNWWLVKNPSLSCSPQQRESVLPMSLAVIQYVFIEDLNMTTDTGITGGQYFAEEESHLGVPPLYLKLNEYSQYCYDATWSLAYALNETINELKENTTLNTKVWDAAGFHGNGTFPLHYFSYNNSVLLNMIFQHLHKTNFSGVTGPVSFSDMGIRALNRLRVLQYRRVPTVNGSTELKREEVATVVGSEEGYTFQYYPGESNDTVWPGGLVPYDGVPLEEDVSVDLPLTVIFSILVTAGIAFAVACLAFNCIFMNKKLIRMSSPNLNYLIVGGAIILYMDIYFYVIPTTNKQALTVLCNITPWLTAVGYSFCYGTILAKMVRVYFIFDNPRYQQKKVLLRDCHLAFGVLALVLVDLMILLVYTLVEGIQGNLTVIRVSNREYPTEIEGELGIITHYYMYICSSTARDIFLGILYGYKMVMQVIALILAFSTRKVKVKGLNDAKYIAAAIYVTSIVLAVIIVATYTLKDFVNAFPTLFCTGFIIGTTSILGLVFVPKMVGLYKDPEGKKLFSRTNPSQGNLNSSMDKDTVASLRKRIQELENEVHNNTSLSKPQAQHSVDSSTHMNGSGDVGEGEACKEGEAVPAVEISVHGSLNKV